MQTARSPGDDLDRPARITSVRPRATAGPPATTPRSARCRWSGRSLTRLRGAPSTAAAASASAVLMSRCVTRRTARGPTGETSTPASRAPATKAGRVVALDDHDVGVDGLGVDAAGLGQEPGVGVVVGEPLDVVVERVEPGRGQDPDLAHPAAHPLATDAGLGHGLRRADHERADRCAQPLGRHTDITSTHAPYDASGTPVATCAFQSRAPSRWTPTPTESAQARSACRSASGRTAPPAKLWVFSTETAVVRTKNGPMSGAYISWTAARSTCPRGSRQVRIVSPVTAPCAPSSARAMWADASQSTSWPGATSERPRARWPSSRSG